MNTILKDFVDNKLHDLIGTVALFKQAPQFFILQKEDNIDCIPTAIENIAGSIQEISHDSKLNGMALLFTADTVATDRSITENEFHTMEKRRTIIAIIHTRSDSEIRTIFYDKLNNKMSFADMGWESVTADWSESFLKNPFK
jgi:hypothetical protein